MRPSKWIPRIHRYAGIVLVGFLIVSAITGFLRANASWYWKPGYKQKKVPVAGLAAPPPVDLAEAFHLAKQYAGSHVAIDQILLKREAGQTVYEVRFNDDAQRGLLLDARTGTVLSPLPEAFIREAAYQYVQGRPPIKAVSLLEHYKPRREKHPIPVYRVEFADPRRTTIYLDRDTGVIVEDLDDLKRFGVWIIKLHEWDFGNFKRPMLSVTGAGFLLLALSGLSLWVLTKR